ncbi:MAG: copper homeostasis protein CutC [Spirochaetaceae bacterium]|nr:copper homeostasis protein CutC [Spirochaetaceae bacterium]
MSKDFIVEACIDSVESAMAVEEVGCRRVELCSALFEGGLTPTPGTVRRIQQTSGVDIMAMIRPRGGDFCYSREEFAVMKEDLKIMKELGVLGVVFGILREDGTIDKERTGELIALARPLKVTFHRAFDVTPEPFAALETLIELGVDRILTSGQDKSVLEGIDLIAELHRKAGGRIIIMPGGGITERNFRRIHETLGFGEYHIGLGSWKESAMKFRRSYVPMGGALYPPEYAVRGYNAQALSTIISHT